MVGAGKQKTFYRKCADCHWCAASDVEVSCWAPIPMWINEKNLKEKRKITKDKDATHCKAFRPYED